MRHFLMSEQEGAVNDVTSARRNAVWNQSEIPVLLRRRAARLRMRVPYGSDNCAWIGSGHTQKPVWDAAGRYWETPRAWFNGMVVQCLDRFQRVYIIQPFHEQEKCAPACWNVKGDECQCSCMGEHHGEQSPAGQWRVVSDTFATKWNGNDLACRLVTRRPPVASVS